MVAALRKEAIEVGFVLWLPQEASSRDRNVYLRSQLAGGACDHPVLVIDTLDPSHDLVWVLIMTSTHNAYHKTLPVLYHKWVNGKLVLTECNGCKKLHAKGETDKMLFHDIEDARMNQHGHVGVGKVYEVSLAMLRQEKNEPCLGYYRLDYRSIVVAKEAVELLMKGLEQTSHAIKTCPRTPVGFDDLVAAIDDFDPDAGYTTGMISPVSTAASPTSSTQPSQCGSAALSNLTRNSASASDTSLSSHSGSDASGAGTDHTPTIDSASHSNKVLKPSRTKAMAKAPDKPSITTSTPSSQPAVMNSTMTSKAGAVSRPDSTSTLAITTKSSSTTAVKLHRPLNSRETVIPNFIKPGVILFNQPGEYRYNRDPTRHMRKKWNRPCIVLGVCETTATVQVLNITAFGRKLLSHGTGIPAEIPASNRKYYLPIPKHGRPDCNTAWILYLAEGKCMWGATTSYVNANEILSQHPSTLERPREGVMRLTDTSLQVLLSASEEAVRMKRLGLTNNSPDPEAGSVGDQQSANLLAPRSLGVSSSSTSAKSAGIARVGLSGGAIQSEGSPASDHARAPRSSASSSYIAELQRKPANSAAKWPSASKTSNALPVPVGITEVKSKTTPAFTASNLTSGTVKHDSLNGTDALGTASGTIPTPSSKVVGATPEVKKSSARDPPTKATAAEAQPDDGSTTLITSKADDAVSSPTVGAATKSEAQSSADGGSLCGCFQRKNLSPSTS